MSAGENLLHVLNTLESRAVVLECELREIDADINLNATMARKYGDDFFAEGAARLTQTRTEKQHRLGEIRAQLSDTSHSVRQGKQLLGTLSDDFGDPVAPPPVLFDEPASRMESSPKRVLTSSPILSQRRVPR
mmetsp:Transcript_20977/g.45026  ORF Transcript_20977/g.45026 Transcript_20977/m.45026 type:complete len:133 (-) Transcript_20977:372-770(-)